MCAIMSSPSSHLPTSWPSNLSPCLLSDILNPQLGEARATSPTVTSPCASDPQLLVLSLETPPPRFCAPQALPRGCSSQCHLINSYSSKSQKSQGCHLLTAVSWSFKGKGFSYGRSRVFLSVAPQHTMIILNFSPHRDRVPPCSLGRPGLAL